MANHFEVCARWVAVADGTSTRKLLKGSRIFADYSGDTLFSYGRHFALAEVLRDEHKAARGFLLNGDRHSVSTTRHQADVLSAVHDSKLPSVTIPFEALRAAGIDRSTIEIVHTLPDRIERTRHESRADSGLPSWNVEVTEDEQGTLWSWTTSRHWLGESLVRATIRGDRSALFLSGFDRNETRRSYFFCELPQSASHVTTVDEALEALKPAAVLLAESEGRQVFRQGDIFAIQTGLTKRELTKRGAVYGRGVSLLGTNHVATEVALLPTGTQLVRGSLRHEPGSRAADHARVKLGDGWFVVVKNTVPVQ